MSKLAPNAEKKSSFGGIAQLVEQMTFNHWVQSSNLCASTRKIKRHPQGCFLFFRHRDENDRVRQQVGFANKVQRNRHGCHAGIYAE